MQLQDYPNCEQVRNWVESGAQLIDVRSEGEFLSNALPNAINVPLPQLPYAAAQLNPQHAYLLYCASGARSGQAKLYLQSLGFRSLANIGGYRAFLDCGRNWQAHHAV